MYPFMRIITGTARGRKLKTPKSDKIRPALDKVKGAIFNILYNVEGLRVLDLFAGTGNIGLEALSRGAANATFVDMLPEAISIIKENIRICGFESSSRVIPQSAGKAINILQRENAKFELIFIDPPYLKDLISNALTDIANAKLLAPGGLIIIEHHPKEPITPPDGLVLNDQRKYGQTLISFLSNTIASI